MKITLYYWTTNNAQFAFNVPPKTNENDIYKLAAENREKWIKDEVTFAVGIKTQATRFKRKLESIVKVIVNLDTNEKEHTIIWSK